MPVSVPAVPIEPLITLYTFPAIPLVPAESPLSSLRWIAALDIIELDNVNSQFPGSSASLHLALLKFIAYISFTEREVPLPSVEDHVDVPSSNNKVLYCEKIAFDGASPSLPPVVLYEPLPAIWPYAIENCDNAVVSELISLL